MATRKNRGLFITLEGMEGTGKSTQVDYLRKLFERAGRKVVRTREPGGTRAGEAIRELLLFRKKGHALSPRTELLLMFAARQQHVAEVILPALKAGRVVLCDRFTDSTYAYQGGGHGVRAADIRALEHWVQGGLRPDLTFLFDLPVEVGLRRAGIRSSGGNPRGRDWFESQALPFFRRVRARYLRIARAEPRRVRLIDAARPIEFVREDLRKLLERRKWI